IISEKKNINPVYRFLTEKFKEIFGEELPINKVKEFGINEGIFLVINDTYDTLAGKEGYYLTVESNRIVVRANEPKGLFYGLQTIIQLLPIDADNSEDDKAVEINIPCVNIFDKPRFSYRGMHLDVCRHFFPVSFIKKYIDLLAMHKMNVFHWHLTEDQGWRIEIEKYPQLTKLGSWRLDSNSKKYGGFYSKREIKEIIKYAEARYITIIPEIEMPGHSLAALAAYPELSCTGGPFQVANTWGVFEDVYCAGNEKTFEFLENIIDEIAELFPSEFIHIGGDECPKIRWQQCDKCQKRIKVEKLKDEKELQSYFIKRIAAFIKTKNKKIIGWDEILEGGIAPEATVMSWRGMKGGIAAAKKGHDVIMSPTSYCYFDYYQAEPSTQPKAIGGFTTLKKVYSFEPVPKGLSTKEAQHIIGAQGNVWTEYIPDGSHVEYMSLPRMCALSEVLWTSKNNRNFKDFSKRMKMIFKRFDSINLNYCEGSYKVEIYTQKSDKKVKITLESEMYQPDIRYTTDGSNPSLKSKKYTGPFQISQPAMIKAGIFKNGKLKEKILSVQVD
ncbi:beta-N-acetylhexosaminidase, partial [candidate division KSB1 bacterium]